jgi:hypothetical protein
MNSGYRVRWNFGKVGHGVEPYSDRGQAEQRFTDLAEQIQNQTEKQGWWVSFAIDGRTVGVYPPFPPDQGVRP